MEKEMNKLKGTVLKEIEKFNFNKPIERELIFDDSDEENTSSTGSISNKSDNKQSAIKINNCYNSTHSEHKDKKQFLNPLRSLLSNDTRSNDDIGEEHVINSSLKEKTSLKKRKYINHQEDMIKTLKRDEFKPNKHEKHLYDQDQLHHKKKCSTIDHNLSENRKNANSTKTETFGLEQYLKMYTELTCCVSENLVATVKAIKSLEINLKANDAISLSNIKIIKDYYFGLSYSTVVTIFVPRKNNIAFQNYIINQVIEIAVKYDIQCEYQDIEPLYKELIEWAQMDRVMKDTSHADDNKLITPYSEKENIKLAALKSIITESPTQQNFITDQAKEKFTCKDVKTIYPPTEVLTSDLHKSSSLLLKPSRNELYPHYTQPPNTQSQPLPPTSQPIPLLSNKPRINNHFPKASKNKQPSFNNEVPPKDMFLSNNTYTPYQASNFSPSYSNQFPYRTNYQMPPRPSSHIQPSLINSPLPNRITNYQSNHYLPSTVSSSTNRLQTQNYDSSNMFYPTQKPNIPYHGPPTEGGNFQLPQIQTNNIQHTTNRYIPNATMHLTSPQNVPFTRTSNNTQSLEIPSNYNQPKGLNYMPNSKPPPPYHIKHAAGSNIQTLRQQNKDNQDKEDIWSDIETLLCYSDNNEINSGQYYTCNKSETSTDKLLETRNSWSRDSGFMSPLDFNITNDEVLKTIDETQESPDALPVITHVTSLNPSAVRVQDGKCTVCGVASRTKCLRCFVNYYCSYECQVRDWKNHYPFCTKEAKKFLN